MNKNVIEIEALDTSKVIITLSNKDYFNGLLDSAVHRFSLDMLIVYKQIISNDEEGVTTRTINPSEIENAGLTMDELDSIAKENTARMFPAVVKDFMGMTIVTNSTGVNGASAILYSDILSEVADMFDDDVYLIPSSIHEFIVVPASVFVGMDFAKMIKNVNDSVLAPKEILSDHPYYFCRKEDAIKIA